MPVKFFNSKKMNMHGEMAEVVKVGGWGEGNLPCKATGLLFCKQNNGIFAGRKSLQGRLQAKSPPLLFA